MKKLLIGICAALACVAVSAQEAESAEAQQAQAPLEQPAWPVWLAFNSTKNIDVAGVRITIPYGE